MGFCHPSAHTRHRGPPAAPAANRRYVPPSGFPDPLGGLLPRSPGRPCFMPTALMGFALRSVSPRDGACGVSTAADPPAVSSRALTADRRRSVAETPGRGSWASFRPRPPIESGAFRQPAPRRELPWAFSLPGQTSEGLRRRSDILSRAWRRNRLKRRALQSIDQPSPGRVRHRGHDCGTRQPS